MDSNLLDKQQVLCDMQPLASLAPDGSGTLTKVAAGPDVRHHSGVNAVQP